MIVIFKNDGSSRGLIYTISTYLRRTTNAKCLVQKPVTTTESTPLSTPYECLDSWLTRSLRLTCRQTGVSITIGTAMVFDFPGGNASVADVT